MLGGQIVLVLSVLMLTAGVTLNRVMLNGYDPMMARVTEHENFGLVGTSALLSSIGAVLFLAAVSLMFVNRKGRKEVDV